MGQWREQLTENIETAGAETIEGVLDELRGSFLAVYSPANHSPLDAILRGNVGSQGGGPGRCGLRDVVDGDVGSVAGKGRGDGGTDAVFAAGASHEGSLAGEGECVGRHCELGGRATRWTKM